MGPHFVLGISLRSKMTCAVKLDYSEGEVRRVNHSLPDLIVPRGKTQVKTSGVRSGYSG